MASRNAIAWLRREKEARLALDEIDQIMQAVAQADDAEARLLDLQTQIERATAVLADVRATAERENRERKERNDEARSRIAKAEEASRARVQEIEHDSVQRLQAERQKLDAELAAIRAAHEEALAEIRAERGREAALLSEIRARREAAQRDLAPFVNSQG